MMTKKKTNGESIMQLHIALFLSSMEYPLEQKICV
jgi:hypothetical protein